MEDTALALASPAESIHCLVIVGHIEGHSELSPGVKSTKYEHILPVLASIEQSPDISGLLILINTAGGDVEAGLAIAEIIAGMKTPTASLVLGGGHSIGVPIAAAASRSFIAPSAAMTLHPVRLTGTVIGAPETYQYLSQMQERIISFVTAHSHMTSESYRRLMNAGGGNAGETGSILSASDAVREGLIDQIGGLSDAMAYLHK